MSPGGIHIIIMSKFIQQKASNNDSDKDEKFSATGSLQDSDDDEEELESSQVSAGLISLKTNARFVVTSITKSSKYICTESRFPNEFFSKLLVSNNF
jgi:hypothetical protein